MAKSENIALFDMDGTIVDFDGQMRRDIERMRSPNEEVIDPWDRSKSWMIERRKTIMKQNGWWKNLPQLAPGLALLHLAVKMGYQIHILTKGPSAKPDAWKEKVEWCHDNLPMKESNIKITMTEDKGLVYGKVLVDDFPEYIEGWLQWRPRGLVIMPAQDHNVNFTHPNVIRMGPYGTPSFDESVTAMNTILKREAGQPLEIN